MTISPKKQAIALAIAVGMAVPGTASATFGYFSSAFSQKAKGMGGAGAAQSLDTMDAAINPANMVMNGNRLDAGLGWFSPRRKYTVDQVGPFLGPETGAFSLLPGTFESDNENFLIPNFGWNYMINDVSSIGITLGGNGGMNTEYSGVVAPNGFEIGTYGAGQVPGANPVAGVDLMQMFTGLTYSRKINETASWGVTAIWALARFKATGLATFGRMSTDPANLTDNGYSTSNGFGGKIGISGEVAPGLRLGASYQSKISMQDFDEYAGLFADGGNFDIPATWTIGAAFNPAPAHTILVDVQGIDYSSVDAISNPMLPNLGMCMGGDFNSCLGGSNGPGFGWEDMTIFRLGYQYDAGDWQARAGFATGDQPIPDSEVLFNILAPATVENHWTLGFTKQIGKSSELDFSFVYVPSVKVTGGNPLAATPAGDTQNITLEMEQYEFGVNYGWKF